MALNVLQCLNLIRPCKALNLLQYLNLIMPRKVLNLFQCHNIKALNVTTTWR